MDVGGRRKGFHAAAVDEEALLAGPVRLTDVRGAVAWLRQVEPRLVAIDSPRSPAPSGRLSRTEERELARRVCGIRYTPNQARLESNSFFEWIEHGLELYAALERAGLLAIECFPTASFTRWAEPRGEETRASWTRRAVAGLGLDGVPRRMNQDGRDAIAAALTARAHHLGQTDSFGAIVVPR